MVETRVAFPEPVSKLGEVDSEHTFDFRLPLPFLPPTCLSGRPPPHLSFLLSLSHFVPPRSFGWPFQPALFLFLLLFFDLRKTAGTMSGCEFSLCTDRKRQSIRNLLAFGKAWLVLTKDSTIPRFNQALHAHPAGGGLAGN
jgi:hypothetical protein